MTKEYLIRAETSTQLWTDVGRPQAVDPQVIKCSLCHQSSQDIKEALLNCTQCHSNDDRHLGLFGEDCVQCHSTDKWSLPKSSQIP